MKQVDIHKKDLEIACNGRIIRGTSIVPAGINKFPMVIFSHGYNGTSSGFDRIAIHLVENGIGVLLYDFCGGSVLSKSSMCTTDMTIFTEKEDLCAILENVTTWQNVDLDNLYLFGASQGGLVSVLVGQEYEAKIKGMILLFPALCIADDWNEKFAKAEDIPDEVEFWGMKLGKNFFMSLRNFKIFEAIGKFQKKVLVMHGDMDPVVPLSYSEKLVEIYPNAHLEVFAGEGHGFSDSAYEVMCEMTSEFIRSCRFL